MEYEENPWGEERADWRSGIIASTIANRHRGPSEKRYQVSDFMPHYGEKDQTNIPVKRQDTATIQALLTAWAEA